MPVALNNKKAGVLERHSKGQFYKDAAYLQRGMPYLRVCGHKCSACQEKQIDFQGTQKATTRLRRGFYFMVFSRQIGICLIVFTIIVVRASNLFSINIYLPFP